MWDLSGLGSNSLSFLAGIKTGENASAIVEVYGDGQLLYTTQTLKAGENAENVYLEISNIKVLKICAVSENKNVQVALADVKLGNVADKEALSLKIGDQAVFLRNNALAPEDRGKAVFKSSNDAVVSVNEKGVVTAVAAGTAEVTADFGKEKVTCQITVTEKTKPEETSTETQPASGTPATPAPGTPTTPAPEVTKTDQTVRGNVIYRILDEKKKTAAVIGAGGNKGKNVTSVTIAKTVNINGVTYKVVQIGKNAFKGCKKLKKVTIGSNIKKIGGSAFVNCSKLKTINMKKANGITSIGSKAFRKINANAKVTVPAKKFKKYSKMLKRAGLPKKAGIKK